MLKGLYFVRCCSLKCCIYISQEVCFDSDLRVQNIVDRGWIDLLTVFFMKVRHNIGLRMSLGGMRALEKALILLMWHLEREGSTQKKKWVRNHTDYFVTPFLMSDGCFKAYPRSTGCQRERDRGRYSKDRDTSQLVPLECTIWVDEREKMYQSGGKINEKGKVEWYHLLVY